MTAPEITITEKEIKAIRAIPAMMEALETAEMVLLTCAVLTRKDPLRDEYKISEARIAIQKALNLAGYTK